MSEQFPGEVAHDLTVRNAAAHLASLREAGGPPFPVGHLAEGGGWSVLELAFPTPATEARRLASLSDCDRSCLRVLAESEAPVPANKVQDLAVAPGAGALHP